MFKLLIIKFYCIIEKLIKFETPLSTIIYLCQITKNYIGKSDLVAIMLNVR